MKKIVLATIVVALLGISCDKNDSSQGEENRQQGTNISTETNQLKTDWSKKNLKGKVKIIKMFSVNTLTITYHYNQNGYIASTEAGNIQSKYHYNHNHLLTDIETEYFQNGSKVKWVLSRYQYDQKGNQVEEKTFGIDGVLSSKTLNTFDSNNRLIEAKTFGANDILLMVSNFDTQGIRTTTTTYDMNGQVISTSEIKNDDNGNIVYIKTLSNVNGIRNENIVTYTYQYDTQGNWIRQTQNSNGIEVIIIKREITYY